MKKCIVNLIVISLMGGMWAGCVSHKPEITQINTIDSLLAGVYDGTVTFGELKQYGNFGIGTCDRLDGEMLMYNGIVYQIRGDGNVYLPPDNVTTPFASVVHFVPQQTESVRDLSFVEFYDFVDRAAPNKNIFLAVAVNGKFGAMHTRSVPAQTTPYRPLAEITQTQPEFKMKDIEGTIVGFRLPAYVKGINVPDYHLHFVSRDIQQGGHILDFTVTEADVEWAAIYQFRMILPKEEGAFSQIDLSVDRSHELKEVESAR